MTEYLITARDPCPECEGSGVVLHHLWPACHEYMREWRAASPGVSNYQSQLASHHDWAEAHQEQIRLWWSEQGYENVPEEEYPCGICGGAGHHDSEIPLADALAALNCRAA